MNPELPLFAYGTLMFPRVIQTAIGRIPPGRRAMARGFVRLELTGQSFPGMIERPSTPEATVDGVLYERLTAAEWQELNDFEGSLYVLTEIPVYRDGETLTALAYLVAPAERSALSEIPWDGERFRDKHLDDFLSGA